MTPIKNGCKINNQSYSGQAMPKFAPIHPGEILKSEFLDELGISPYMLAKNTGIDKGNLSRIINGKSSISADTALRLARFFGTSPDSWMNLQTRYDLEVAKDRSQQRIEQEVRPYKKLSYKQHN
jgi:addiction module HigA family antidote